MRRLIIFYGNSRPCSALINLLENSPDKRSRSEHLYELVASLDVEPFNYLDTNPLRNNTPFYEKFIKKRKTEHYRDNKIVPPRRNLRWTLILVKQFVSKEIH